MQATLLVLYAIKPALRSRATLAAAVLSLLDAIGLCMLSRAEHINSVRPSVIINAYLVLTLPFDAAKSRTLWLDGATKSTAAIFSSSVALKVMILVAEAIEKRGILLDRYRHVSPEVTSGLYSRSFFWWLNNLMTTGFSRIITNEDLYPIDDDMTSRVLSERAHEAWKAADQTKPRALLWITLKANLPAFLYCIFPRICLIGFRYAQPLLLFRTVTFSEDLHETESIGYVEFKLLHTPQ